MKTHKCQRRDCQKDADYKIKTNIGAGNTTFYWCEEHAKEGEVKGLYHLASQGTIWF